jgi:WD40 repeat protein
VREREIFLAAAEIDEQYKRQEYVNQVCGDDAVLRQRIADLLAIHQQEQDYRNQIPSESGYQRGVSAAEERAGAILGRYKLLEKIGEGGFARIYMAEQSEPVRRRVALKIIKAGMDTTQVIARFEAERQALALMDHPNIAKIFDGGVTPTGRPFFVMELVGGTPITEFCDTHRLTTDQRLRVFVQVCHAIQHAHQKGIIHRDIKPSNILVAMQDDSPMPKVIDFGIAKATEQSLTDRTLFTRFHQFIGTPAYMSPEQATMGGLAVDTRSDVYALGAVLYEVLIGVTPLDRRQLDYAAFDEMTRIVREEQPSLPSARISTLTDKLATIVENRRIDSQGLRRFVRGDLDWIIMKTLEKDRARRYDSVGALIADVQHFLARELVSAGPPSAVYRLRKFVARNRGPVAASIALGAALIAGTVGSTMGLVSAVRAKNEAVMAKNAADVARLEEADARRTALEEIERKRELFFVADTSNAKQAWDAGNVDYAVDLLHRHVPKPGESDLRTFAWYYLSDQCRRYESSLPHKVPLHAVAYSPDGKFVATGGEGGLVTFWSTKTRDAVFTLPVEIETVMSLCFSPDASSLVIAGGSGHHPWEPPGRLELWDWNRRTLLRTLEPGKGMVNCVVFTLDGQKLACTNFHGRIHIWDLADKDAEPTISVSQPEPVTYSIAFSPDGRQLAAGTSLPNVNRVRIWNTGTGKEDKTLGTNGLVRALTWSPDGETLAVATHNIQGPVSLFDMANGDVRTLPAETCVAESLLFSADSEKLFVGNWKGSILIFDMDDRKPQATLKGHSSVVSGLALSRDGKTLASCSHDRTLKLWNVADVSPPETVTIGHAEDAAWLRFSHNSKLLATSGYDGTVRIWEVETGRLLDTVHEGRQAGTRQMAFSPDDRRLAWSENDRAILIHDFAGERQQSLGELGFTPLGVTFSRDGRQLSMIAAQPSTTQTGNHLLSTRAWNADTLQLAADPQPLASITLAPSRGTETPGFPLYRHFQVVPDSRRRLSHNGLLYAQVFGSSVSLWNVTTGQKRVLLDHSEAVLNLAFSSDDSLLASCGQDRSIRLWNTATGELVETLRGRTIPLAVAFSADTKTLATGDIDGKVTLWDLRTTAEILALNAAAQIVTSLAFAPNGEALACGTLEGQVRIWRAPRDERR